METAELTARSEAAVEWQRVAIFCLLAFAISGSAAIYVALNGGLQSLVGVQALVVLALWYMPGPALAHLLTRLITREGWSDLWLRPYFRKGWRSWIAAWFLPAILVIAGAVLYFVLFPQHFDPTYGAARALLDQTAEAGTPLPFGPEVLILIQVVQAVLIAPLLNALPTLGEEFGWRAYLQPKLMPLGWRRAMVLMGIIWGVWHWPILAMGYNYGMEYAGAPWLGMLAFVWFTMTFGTLLGWLTVRGGSVWPAVIGHGALNGIAGLSTLFTQGEPNLLLGPMAHGLLAGIPLALVALWLWWHPPVELHTGEAKPG
jgi:membrane protease YdiL (CAAX protease family)